MSVNLKEYTLKELLRLRDSLDILISMQYENEHRLNEVKQEIQRRIENEN